MTMAPSRIVECQPTAEREARCQCDAIKRHVKIGAREADTIDIARLDGALLAEGLRDL